MPRVLAIDSSRWICSTRLPSLLRGAAELHVVGHRRHAVRWSLWTRRFIPLAVDPAAQLKQLLENEGPWDWVTVIDDRLLLTLARLALTEAWCRPCLPMEAGALLENLSKLRFPAYCAALGLKVPAWAVVDGAASVDAALERVPGPWVVKSDFGWGGIGVRMADGPAQVKAAVAGLGPGPVLLQRRIAGRTGGTSFMAKRGRLLSVSSVYKAATYNGPLGGSSAVEPAAPPNMEHHVRRFVEATGYHGLGEWDWQEEAPGQEPQLLELNARMVTFHHNGGWQTQDLRRAARGMFQDPILPADAPVLLPRPLVLHYPQYLQHCLKSPWSKRWLLWFKPGVHWDLPWMEPGILCYQGAELLWGFVKARLKPKAQSAQELAHP